MKVVDRIGQRFGRLVVVSRATGKDKRSRWVCSCDCGGVKSVHNGDLQQGKTRSCGCLRQGNSTLKTHGMSGTPTHKIWLGMLKRCNYAGDKNYQFYGGRGIRVCERWREFKNFYADMGDRPENMSIDRIDSSKDYCPENCRWADAKTQARNTRHCKLDEQSVSIVKSILKYDTELGVIKRVAKCFGVVPETIGQIRAGHTWVDTPVIPV